MPQEYLDKYEIFYNFTQLDLTKRYIIQEKTESDYEISSDDETKVKEKKKHLTISSHILGCAVAIFFPMTCVLFRRLMPPF